MSFFILPQEQFCTGAKDIKSERWWNPENAGQSSRTLSLGKVVKNELKSVRNCFLSKTTYKNKDQQYTLKTFDIDFGIKALFSIKLSKKLNGVSFLVDVLENDEYYYKANNLFQTTQISRNIMFQHSCLKQALVCLKLNPFTRQIQMQLPLFFNYNSSTLVKSYKNAGSIHLVMQSLVQPHLSLISNSLRNVLKAEGRTPCQDLSSSHFSKKLVRINRINLISNISSHVSCHPQSEAKFLRRNAQSRRQTMESWLKNRSALQAGFLKNIDLYTFGSIGEMRFKDEIDELIIEDEQRSLKEKISFFFPSQSQRPQQNYQIENIIQLKGVLEICPQKLTKGGFAEIFTADVGFWYPYYSDGETPNPKSSSNNFKQRLVLKAEKIPNKFLQKSMGSQFQKSRKEHEIKIIYQMKGGKSLYLPKYYFPIGLGTQIFTFYDRCLFMEYIPYKTLAQLLQSNVKCLSLHSKVNLMYSTCQGLRYLRDFGIVHLDLKPNNIMLYYNSYVKLIDFGQSYHPQVCQDDFRPGFTAPYSPPQIFDDNVQVFTSKSDVFSFGVIFYKMLFNRSPFEINKCTTQFDWEMRKYLQYWYYSPQEGELYGQGEVLRILFGLISKCLIGCPNDRPELDWIALNLKLIMEAIN